MKSTGLNLLLLLPAMLLPVGALAQEPGTLLRIAEQADEQILYQLGVQAPAPEIRELYEAGHASVELLRAEPEGEQARAHFLAAMGNFGQAGRMLAGDGVSDRDVRSELDRLEMYVEQLRKISTAQGMGVDFVQLDALMDLAKSQVSGEATGDPASTLDSIGPLVDALATEIRERAADAEEARVRAFIEEQLAEFEPRAADVPGAQELVSQIRIMLSEGRTNEAKLALSELAQLLR